MKVDVTKKTVKLEAHEKKALDKARAILIVLIPHTTCNAAETARGLCSVIEELDPKPQGE